MSRNVLYIAVMALVSYTIRVLPLTLIRKPIKNRFIQSFLYYVPYVTLAVMTFPAIINATQSPIAGAAALVVALPPHGSEPVCFRCPSPAVPWCLCWNCFWCTELSAAVVLGRPWRLFWSLKIFRKLVTFRRFCRLMGEPVPKHTKRRDAHMEHRSFEQIYLQYYKPVYAYLMTLCQNEELAAELTQETFYKALDAIDGFKGAVH